MSVYLADVSGFFPVDSFLLRFLNLTVATLLHYYTTYYYLLLLLHISPRSEAVEFFSYTLSHFTRTLTHSGFCFG